MKKLMSFLVSRGFLALIALIVVALCVWFLGPYVAFGGLRPLESIALRVLVIALFVCAALLWLKGWSTAAVFGAFLCLLIWYAAPLLSFGSSRPFVPGEARVFTISIVIALFVAWGLYRLWRRMRQDETFLRKALAFDTKKVESPAAARLKEIEGRLNSALARLKSIRTGASRITRVFQSTRYLYELPWYITLGAVDSGKTRMLLSAGLPLPTGVAPLRPGSAAAKSNVEWWLTNEAVFVDTAGFYVHPGSSRHALPLAPEHARSSKDKPPRALANVPAETRTSSLDEAAYRRTADADEWFGRYKTLPGSTEPVQGPDLEPFQHAQAIRNVFFGDQGKQLAWKAELRVPELDSTILSLAIDIDGQTMLYQHGPVTPLKLSWPGPRGGVHVEITASPRIRAETSTIAVDGPWALLRLLRRGQIVQTATAGRTRVVFEFDGRQAVLDMANAGSVANPLTSDVLTTFRCPNAMPMFNLADSGPPPELPAVAAAAGSR